MTSLKIDSAAPEAPSALKEKTGVELNAQRFKMLEDIAADLAGDVVFPTCFDVVVRLRQALQDPHQSIGNIAAIINLEPLLVSKLLLLANSVTYSRGSKPIYDVASACNRVGITVVRKAAIAISMKQLMRLQNSREFEDLKRQLWEHSVYSASAAYVIARRLSSMNADQAMLAGLVHDLGAFYMIYRATEYEELRIRPDTVKHLVFEWHESIGNSLLVALGLPEEIVEACYEHEQIQELTTKLRNLRDVVAVANVVAARLLGKFAPAPDTTRMESFEIPEQYLELKDEIQAKAAEMMEVFS